MLTVTEPIELNIRQDLVTAGEGFCNRMSSNYQMMDTDVSPEDMLHVSTAPPEFYFGEESSNIYNTNTQINIREQSVANIVNNLVNRIMVAPEYNMSYQDRVYISNALKKLGIKDESTFMKQVFAMREEINNTNELINLYFSYGENIKNLVEEYTSSDRYDNRQIDENSTQNLHLHEDVYRRLQTGLIYSIVENFVENSFGFDVVSHNEMLVAEQKRVMENILLKELQSDARGEQVPLVYRSDNYYEDFDFTEENSTDEKITEVINSATLLNFITNAIETKVSNQNRNINNWYLVRPQIQTTVENTLHRIENNLRSEDNRQIYNTTNTQIQARIRQNEIDIINSIVEGDTNITNFEAQNLSYNVTEEGDTYVEQLEQLNENLRQDNIRREENQIHFEQVFNEEREKVRRKLSPKERKERQRQDALAALESPEEIIMTLRQEQALADENEEKIKEAARNATIPEKDQIFNLIDQYIANPSQGIPGAIVTHDDVGTLMSDIERVNILNREALEETTQTSETIERVTKEIAKEAVSEATTTQASIKREVINNLNLVHRSTDNIDIEEVTEQIAEQNRKIIETVRNNDEQIVDINRSSTTTVNENIYDETKIERELERMVTNHVSQSLNNLSDQVYRKIENKLEMEKRRRGL